MQNQDSLTVVSIILTILLPVINAATEAVKPRGRRIGLVVMASVVATCVALSVFWQLSGWIVAGGVVVLVAWVFSPHLTRPIAATIELGRSARSLGIVRLEKSIGEGGTDTAAIMASAKDSIDVVAFAGSKFLRRYDKLESVAREGKGCRFVMVNPASDAVENLSERWGYEENRLAEIIRGNLGEVNYLRGRGFRIDVRFAPCNLLRFRLVVVDRKMAYISYYRAGRRGLSLPQLVVDTSAANADPFLSELLELFEDIWNCGSEVVWSEFPSREPTRQSLA